VVEPAAAIEDPPVAPPIPDQVADEEKAAANTLAAAWGRASVQVRRRFLTAALVIEKDLAAWLRTTLKTQP
jgi:hypothetical protein